MLPMPSSDAAASEFLTVRETADLLKVTPLTVRRRVNAGTLPAIRFGDGPHAPIRIASGDLADYLRRVNQ